MSPETGMGKDPLLPPVTDGQAETRAWREHVVSWCELHQLARASPDSRRAKHALSEAELGPNLYACLTGTALARASMRPIRAYAKLEGLKTLVDLVDPPNAIRFAEYQARLWCFQGRGLIWHA